ncbi:hypothetical protein D9O40_18250 [Clostridium autoethanogenum]|uniref:HTH-like domain-containing protein n=1 Tax=Clostridium autoethanogenum TaxID=84023 RepID=A0A3M0S622_9CLOT|nr:hypothetical protein [Clostridium autoethanogenum]RMC93020.1 hypothetical protein D9O40_18250 [Clostridium autoethanogenum]
MKEKIVVFKPNGRVLGKLPKKILCLRKKIKFKKSFIHIRKDKIEDIYKFYKFIDKYDHYYCKKINKCFEIKVMCKVLGISNVVYYKHFHRRLSKWKKEDEILDKEIYEEYKDSKGIYDAIKIRNQIIKKGFHPNLKRSKKRKINYS